MNSATYKAIKAILATDDSVTADQRNTALAVLSNRIADKKEILPLLLTQKQAAQLLGVSRFTIWRLTQEGVLHPVKLRESFRYQRAAIEALATPATLHAEP